MKVLVACEFSGVVRDAFLRRDHDAWSCDLLPTESIKLDETGAVRHIQGDVLGVLNADWDLMIAHPPCTYLSRAAGRWLYPNGRLDQKRYQKGLEAKRFFYKLLNAKIPCIAVENPTPFTVFGLSQPSQVIQPYQFGHPFSKRTLLWLRNLPLLKPVCTVENYIPYLPSNTGGKKRGQRYSSGVSKNTKKSSITFQGIADAMACQWG